MFVSYILDKAGLKKLASQVAKIIKPGFFIALNGELGTGKTFFVSSLLECLSGDKVSSPTYTIVNEYNSNKGLVVHIDAYRIEEKDLDSINFFEYLDQNVIIIVEWANKIEKFIPEKKIQIDLQYLDDRRIVNVYFNV